MIETLPTTSVPTQNHPPQTFTHLPQCLRNWLEPHAPDAPKLNPSRVKEHGADAPLGPPDASFETTSDHELIAWALNADDDILAKLEPDEISDAIDKLLEGVTPSQKRKQKKLWKTAQQRIQKVFKHAGLGKPSPEQADACIRDQLDKLDPHMQPEQLTELMVQASAADKPDTKLKQVPKFLQNTILSDSFFATWLLSSSAQTLAGSSSASYSFLTLNILSMIRNAMGIHRGRGILRLGKVLEQRAEEARARGNLSMATVCEERSRCAHKNGSMLILQSSCAFTRSLLWTSSMTMNIAVQALQTVGKPVGPGTTLATTAIGSTTGALILLTSLLTIIRETPVVIDTSNQKERLIHFLDCDLPHLAHLPGTAAEVRLALDLIDYKLHQLNTRLMGSTLEMTGGVTGLVMGSCGIAVAAGVSTAGIGLGVCAAVMAVAIGSRVGITQYRKWDWKRWQDDLVEIGEARSTHGPLFAALYNQIQAELAVQQIPLAHQETDQRIALEFEATKVDLSGVIPRKKCIDDHPRLFSYLCELVLGIPGELFVQLVDSSADRYNEFIDLIDPRLLDAQERRVHDESLPIPIEQIDVHHSLDPQERAIHLLHYLDAPDALTRERHLNYLVHGEGSSTREWPDAKHLIKQEQRRKRILRDLAKPKDVAK